MSEDMEDQEDDWKPDHVLSKTPGDLKKASPDQVVDWLSAAVTLLMNDGDGRAINHLLSHAPRSFYKENTDALWESGYRQAILHKQWKLADRIWKRATLVCQSSMRPLGFLMNRHSRNPNDVQMWADIIEYLDTFPERLHTEGALAKFQTNEQGYRMLLEKGLNPIENPYCRPNEENKAPIREFIIARKYGSALITLGCPGVSITADEAVEALHCFSPSHYNQLVDPQTYARLAALLINHITPKAARRFINAMDNLSSTPSPGSNQSNMIDQMLLGCANGYANHSWPDNDLRLIPHFFRLVELGFPLPERSIQHPVAQEFLRLRKESRLLHDIVQQAKHDAHLDEAGEALAPKTPAQTISSPISPLPARKPRKT